MAREIGTICNEMLFAGRHQFNVRDKIQGRLSYGQYIYRISTGGQYYSKSILIR